MEAYQKRKFKKFKKYRKYEELNNDIINEIYIVVLDIIESNNELDNKPKKEIGEKIIVISESIV